MNTAQQSKLGTPSYDLGISLSAQKQCSAEKTNNTATEYGQTPAHIVTQEKIIPLK